MNTKPIERGCGRRQAGGVYLESGSGGAGMSIEFFMLDQPMAVPEEWRVPSIGVTTVRASDDVSHIVDHVGSSHYAEPTDFIEEARIHGVSRRVSSSFDFRVLSKHSKILLAHSRAGIDYTSDDSSACPKFRRHIHKARVGYCCDDRRISNEFLLPEYLDRPHRCIHLLYSAVQDVHAYEGMVGYRKLKCGERYVCSSDLREEPRYRAIFMVVPVERIVLVDDPTDPAKIESLREKIAPKISLPFTIEDL